MTTGEMMQMLRLHERTILVQAEQIETLIKEVYEIKDIMKSPIRRAVHASKSQQSEGRI